MLSTQEHVMSQLFRCVADNVNGMIHGKLNKNTMPEFANSCFTQLIWCLQVPQGCLKSKIIHYCLVVCCQNCITFKKNFLRGLLLRQKVFFFHQNLVTDRTNSGHKKGSFFRQNLFVDRTKFQDREEGLSFSPEFGRTMY